jgi:hypothetical protein
MTIFDLAIFSGIKRLFSNDSEAEEIMSMTTNPVISLKYQLNSAVYNVNFLKRKG